MILLFRDCLVHDHLKKMYVTLHKQHFKSILGVESDQIDEFDMTTQASFISFALQCLMCVSKWESMVDISNRLNSATENQFASQLLPFIIYA